MADSEISTTIRPGHILTGRADYEYRGGRILGEPVERRQLGPWLYTCSCGELGDGVLAAVAQVHVDDVLPPRSEET